MKKFLFGMLFLVLGFASFANEPKPEDTKKKAIAEALDPFIGTWEIVTVKPDGITKQASHLVFRKDKTYSAVDKEGKELWGGTFDLDPTTTPKVWDHRTYEAKKQGGDALGIYELSGDKLKVCCVVGAWKDQKWTGKPRPTEFKLESADAVLELRRVKIEKK